MSAGTGSPSLLDVVADLQRRAASEFTLADICFPKQLDFVSDLAPFATACCSRRAGKTTGCAADLLAVALEHPGTAGLYVTVARTTAKQIMWPVLKQLARDYKVVSTVNETTLQLTLSNGSIIICAGAKDLREIDKLRGQPFKRAYIDEAQNFRTSLLKILIDDVLEPALMDYGGDLRVIGTPGAVPAGMFWELCNAEGWSHHAWTFFDNPHIASKSGKTHMQTLERVLKRRGVPITDPSIQREYFGKWVSDLQSLVLHYTPTLNGFGPLPVIAGKWHCVLGVDLGWKDADALAVLAWYEGSRTVWLVDEVVTSKQTITELAAQIETLRSKWDISKIVVDTGGLGKKVAEEIQKRFGIPLTAADKTRKMENLTLLNDTLRRGDLKSDPDGQFAHDCMLVEWDYDKSSPERLVVSKRYHSDIMDAVLYAWKETPAYAWREPEAKPKPGTKEANDQFQAELERLAEEHFQRLAEDAAQEP